MPKSKVSLEKGDRGLRQEDTSLGRGGENLGTWSQEKKREIEIEKVVWKSLVASAESAVRIREWELTDGYVVGDYKDGDFQ